MIEKLSLAIDDSLMYFKELYFKIHSPKYFRDRDPAEKVVSFKTLLEKSYHKTKKISEEYWELYSIYDSQERITKIFLHTAYDKKKPSIVFHHGSGQINYLNLIKRTLGKRYWKEYNVFSIKAQHHENKKEYLAGCMNSFLNLQLTFVGSVLALEEIIRFHKQMSKKKITATGISMGGIVASLHFILFNTADFYIPIVAYPNAAEIYLGRAFENAVDKVEDRKKNKSYFMAFSFNNNISIKNKVKVFPILAKYDWYVNFDKAVKFWEGYDLKVYDLGHKSIAIKFLEIQKYMLEKTEEKN